MLIVPAKAEPGVSGSFQVILRFDPGDVVQRNLVNADGARCSAASSGEIETVERDRHVVQRTRQSEIVLGSPMTLAERDAGHRLEHLADIAGCHRAELVGRDHVDVFGRTAAC